MRSAIFLYLALTAGSTLAAGQVPPTERKPVTDVINGVELVDPFRWLEGSAAPELKGKADAELDERVAAWTDAQNAYTRSVLDNLPGLLKNGTREFPSLECVIPMPKARDLR